MRKKSEIIIGDKKNLLTLIKEAEIQYNKNIATKLRKVECKCDCGNIVITRLVSFLSGYAKSCGCLIKIQAVNNLNRRTHSLSNHPLYHIWGGLIQRCYNIKSEHYHNYGGRGVEVCPKWRKDFKAFYMWAIKNKWAKGLCIDKDIKGNGLLYSPKTCCIATYKENANKRTNNHYVTFKGKEVTIAQLAEKTGITYATVYYRIRMGKSIKDVVKK